MPTTEICQSPPFLKVKATIWGTESKGYQFDTHFWNNKSIQITLKDNMLLIMNDMNEWEDTDHINANAN